MRIGLNPNNNKETALNDKAHRVIIPVYIPNQEGYFKDSFKILQFCIDSLLLTSHTETYITIVNNGSCSEVVRYLDDLFVDGKIHELIHTGNIGKLNAVLKGLAGQNMPLITIADADVLFLNGWQEQTIEIFNAFPKAGVVGLTPQFKQFASHCGNVLLAHLFDHDMCFSEVRNPSALKEFYRSIGWDENYNQDYLKQYLTITKNNNTAVVGAGHYVATYRKEVFHEIVTHIAGKIGGNSEKYLDKAPLKKGLWRLTTAENYAFHMGNNYEVWMDDILGKTIKNDLPPGCLKQSVSSNNISGIIQFIQHRLFPKVFANKVFRKMFYQFKGLPKEMVNRY